MKDFLDHLSAYQIFLGSQSPRRKNLMEQLGIPFQVWLKDPADESFPEDLSADEVATYLAKKKTIPYLDQLREDTILITADTVVIREGLVLGKPKDYEEASRMLRELSGRSHRVVTGICMRSVKQSCSFSANTEVTFDELTPEEIHYYITEFGPFDKAGSYGIQEWIGLVGVESINGSYFNVMGLPIHQVYQKLKHFTNYKPKAS